ncbi:MAG: MBL fold metallo-hydrolase [Opitutales bacterium]|nr:MBL fold metallo-hydrolase [Opitutales bacterium]
MRITDLNKAGGIGANSLFVELGAFQFIVDSGLNPKETGGNTIPDFSALEGAEINFIVITHCHLDHIGSLPILMRKHPNAHAFMSQSSQMLIERMLHNSCNVMTRQRAEHNIEEYPLFTHEEVDRISDRFEVLPFGKSVAFIEDEQTMELTLHAAGHVAGAGGLEINHQGKRRFFTGDVLFDKQQTLPGAKFPKERTFDSIILETTRGETERPKDKTRPKEIARLLETITATLHRGGSVLIPVFALGRMQEILTILNNARKQDLIPTCPIFGAGLGMAIADHLDQISKRTGQVNFTRKTIKELRLKRPPRKLTPGKEPAVQGIYILSSGMMVARTPSYGLAASLIHQARNSICFVGYCDPSTPGGKLLESGPGETFVFETLDYQTTIRAQIDRFEMSGHADREELLNVAVSAKPKTIVLTHGDIGARDWFAKALMESNPKLTVIDPKPLETIEIE